MVFQCNNNSVDPFTRKDWYDIKAPSTFDVRQVGKTLVNRTQGLKNANDALKGRVLEISLADLHKNEEYSFRKIKLRVDEVQGKNCLTNFHGMDMTSDKLRSMVRKWQVRSSIILHSLPYVVEVFVANLVFRRSCNAHTFCHIRTRSIVHHRGPR